MKKLLLLTKTLLAAALLCVGQNAWAETYDFSSGHNGNFTYPSGHISYSNGNWGYMVTDAWLNGRFSFQDGTSSGVHRNYWTVRQFKTGGVNVTGLNNTQSTAYLFGIHNLKNGDVIIITMPDASNDKIKAFTTNITKDGEDTPVSSLDQIVSGTRYVVTTSDPTTSVEFQGLQYCCVSNIQIISASDAIEDCKSHETSVEFATYIDGLYDAGNVSTIADVYAAHTAWQIAKADAASSNDITKVIFDAAVSDFTRWNNARNNSGQQYTGAPDNKYFDGWYNQASDASQTIYGLPAGTYTLKVATRASAEATNTNNYNVWVNGGTANVKVLGNHIGSTGGCLGNGWNWTIASFTLDATANVSIGFYAKPGNSGDTKYWAGADDWHLYKGSLSETATIGAKGYTTFSSSCPLNLASISGGTAYKVIASDVDGTVVTPSAVTGSIAAGEGLILSGTPNSKVTIPVVASGDAISGNLMVGCPIGATINKETSNYEKFYVLVNDETVAKFANLTDWVGADKTVNIPANKAYLNIPSPSARSMSIVLGDKVTGVANVEAAAEAKAKEGKFIENGKLVIVKNGQKFNAAGAKLY